MGKRKYGINVRCKDCGVIVVAESKIGEKLQCPACDSYNVEELFVHHYSSDGELVQKTSFAVLNNY